MQIGTKQVKKMIRSRVPRSFIDACKQHPIVDGYKRRTPFFRRFPPSSNLEAIESRTRIDTRLKCVYSRIPKAANSTVAATLFIEKGQTPDNSLVLAAKFGDVRASGLSRKQVAEVLDSYFKFTVVRNPYTRILSAYRDKIAKGGQIKEIFTEHIGVGVDEEISFDGFLDFLAENTTLMLDAHWIPQTDLLAFPVPIYDYVGSLENLSQDLPFLQNRLGMEGQTRDFRPHKTGSNEAVNDLSRSQIEKIQKIYESDFESLNYEYDPTKLSRISDVVAES